MGVRRMHSEKALRDYLREEIFPSYPLLLMAKSKSPAWTTINRSISLWKKGKPALAVGKSFKYGEIPLDKAWSSADREYSNLKLVRDKFGMEDGSYEIVSPLGEKEIFRPSGDPESHPGICWTIILPGRSTSKGDRSYFKSWATWPNFLRASRQQPHDRSGFHRLSHSGI